MNLFKTSNLKNSINSYIERCFSIVSDNENFLEKDYKFLSKILASSEFHITLEIEVIKQQIDG